MLRTVRKIRKEAGAEGGLANMKKER